MKNKSLSRLSFFAFALAASMNAPQSVHAANAYYSTNSTSTNWSTAVWTMGNNGTHGATAPNTTDAGNIVYFVTTTQTLTLDGNITVGALSVSSQPGGSSVGHGSALTINASGSNAITMNGTGLTTILSGSSLAGTFVSGEASINVNQNNSATSIKVNPDIIMMGSNLGIGASLSTGTVTIGGNITNGDSAARQLNFRGNNAGSVTINGTIGATLGGGGNLTIQNLGTSTAPVNVNGAIGQYVTSVTQNSASSIITLSSGANSYTGGTNILQGSLAVGASGTLGVNLGTNNVAVSPGGNLLLAAASSLGNLQTLTVTSNATALGGIGVTADITYPAFTNNTGASGGVYGINFTGTNGITSLATLDNTLNANTGNGTGHWYLGTQTTATFNGTTLAPASDSTYRIGGGGGTLTISQPNVLTGANAVLVNSASTNGGGTVILGAAQNFTGNLTVNAGTLKLGNAGALGDNSTHTAGVTVGGAAIFDLGGVTAPASFPLYLNSSAGGFDVGCFYNTGSNATFSGQVTLNANTRVGAGNILLSNAITGNGKTLLRDGVGTLELSNSGSVALGALQANRGTIQVDAGSTLNVTSISVGTGNGVGSGLTLNGGNVTSSSVSAATFASSTNAAASGTLQLNGGTLTVAGLAKGGTAVATFNANFNGGTLKASGNSTTFFTGANNAKVQAGGAFIDDGGFAITIAQPLTYNGTLGAPDGGLTKTGAGTLTLTGNNTYNGTTTVSAGTLLISGGGRINATSGITVGSGSLVLGASNVLNDAAPITLAGGTLNAGTFSETVDALTLSGNSFLSLSSGGAIAFANSSAATWGAFTIDITGFVSGSSLRFGTDSLGLDGTQLGKFTASGFESFSLDGSGYLLAVAVPEPGTCLLVGIGLTFLLHRRRAQRFES